MENPPGPLPEKVSTRATTLSGERDPPAPVPSVLLELGYDNPDDALWIQENLPASPPIWC